ncbi:helix-turn-helix transcriptional regulator [Phycicoccus sp. CSK15P-2]|uniref:helix-turn-helix transcriptional regulator n=1 Tax=Phycicoccus sp. CSK15P-2 TaxID=2807627 RepID=UPI00194F5353|nr:helix-turn-helix transcriptional regulator [Phycicoccus sp. CSK15P-2]MBM6403590.1 helix-turn-helix transcriptional regulator [Phycicoccus sp. CSK15P-2]MBM6405055.1 helix-turn-helix transcriptional regulator [Phycicoccus sp. CSK15P-2]
MTDPLQTGFFDHVAQLMLANDPRVTLLGPLADASRHLTRGLGGARVHTWNMQVSVNIPALREGLRREQALTHLGSLDMCEITTRTTLRINPLYASAEPKSRVADVAAPLLIVDQSQAFLAGPDGTRHEATIWETTDPGLVARACETFLATWVNSRPIIEIVDRPLLESRRLQVALHLAEGGTDREIATALGTSQRTVSTEIRHIIDWLGARNRAHAVAMLVGADQ